MSKEQFYGTWTIVASEIQSTGGEVVRPFGDNPKGVIIYDSGGNMSIQLYSMSRPQFSAGDQTKGTDDENRAAVAGSICYFGKYSVDEQEGTVSHKVDASVFPNWNGAEKKRFYKFEGDTLTLSTPPIPHGGETRTGMFVWKKIG